MKEIRRTIYNQLSSIHPRVYFIQAPSTASFPYLIYSIEITNLGDDLKIVTLDVDGWDNQDDTTDIELLMSEVKRKLNKNLIINDDVTVAFYLDRQLALTGDSPDLKRRTNIFMGRLYERVN